MLGVGRKPPSVLRRYSPKRLTCEQSGQLIPLFRLAPGADWPFQQIPLETSTPNMYHCIIQGLCRFCASAEILTSSACVDPQSRAREDFPQHKAVNRPPTPNESNHTTYTHI